MISTQELGKRLSKFGFIGKRPYSTFSANSDSTLENELDNLANRPVKKILKTAHKNPGEFIQLYGKNKIQIFPIFEDSDLKFEGKFGSCTQRTVIDDDNDTSESLKDKGIKKMFRYMKTAVKEARRSQYGSCRMSNCGSWENESVVSFDSSMIEVDNSGGFEKEFGGISRSQSMVVDRECFRGYADN